MTYKHYGLFAFVIVIVIVIGVAIVASSFLLHEKDAELERYRAKAGAFDLFCRKTRISIESVLHGLESDDAERQRLNADMLNRDGPHYGYTSVATCLGDLTPREPDELITCMMEYKYACLAKQVHAYRDALVKAGW